MTHDGGTIIGNFQFCNEHREQVEALVDRGAEIQAAAERIASKIKGKCKQPGCGYPFDTSRP